MTMGLRPVNLLDRYIFKSALFTCAAAVGIFTFILASGTLVRDIIGQGLFDQLSLPVISRLTLLQIPYVIPFALPVGILTGVLLTLGRLSADSEITAMRASGIGLPRIARPVIILGALGMLAGLPINFEYMPWAGVQYDRELTVAVRANPLSFIVPRSFIRAFPGVIAYVGEKKGADVRDVWLWKLDEDRRVTEFIRAAAGRVDYDEAANEFILTLSDAQVENRSDRNPEDFTEAQPVMTFSRVEPIHLPLGRVFSRSGFRQKLTWMTYAELRREQARKRIDDRLSFHVVCHGIDGEVAAEKISLQASLEHGDIEGYVPGDDPVRLGRPFSEKKRMGPKDFFKRPQIRGQFNREVVVVRETCEGKLPQCAAHKEDLSCEIETLYLPDNGEASYPVSERDQRGEHGLSGLLAKVAHFLGNPLQGVHNREIEERSLGRAGSGDEPFLVLHPGLCRSFANAAGGGGGIRPEMGVPRGDGIIRVPRKILKECHDLADLRKGLVGEAGPRLHHGLHSAHEVFHSDPEALACGQERQGPLVG